jgi:thiamine pyrophosphokinase
MARFAILMGGDLTPTPRLRAQLHGARMIAADGGMRHAAALGVEPELWVGDFDSSPGALIDAHHQVPKQVHPAEKDATDGELAVAEAQRRGATEIVCVGGLGGQMDHATAQLGLLLDLAGRSITSFATSGVEEAYPLLPGSLSLDLQPDNRISIVPWRACEGFTISGVKWPLEDRDLALGSGFTLSNAATGAVQITLRNGAAIIFAYPA